MGRIKKIGEILVEQGLVTRRQLRFALKTQIKTARFIGIIPPKNKSINDRVTAVTSPLKYKILIITASLLLCILALVYLDYLPFLKNIDRRIYSGLLNAEHTFRKLPTAINDIVIVGIDNETVENMPYRWPYPRTDTATVIENLKKARPLAIGVDLAYFGKTTPADDDLLKQAFNSNKVILAATISEYGYLAIPDDLLLGDKTTYGITTKLQDEDGIIRRNLIYLVSKKKKQEGFLSWEMQILKSIKGIDPASITEKLNTITFKNKFGEKWDVPVDPIGKSFLIHFRAHTKDFKNISFYQALKGNFDPRLIKNKIVLIGVLPALFQDIHNTSFGFLPGVVLNANALLALYTHDFLIRIPKPIKRIVVIIGVTLASIFLLFLSPPGAAIMITLEICLFFILSYILLVSGYAWNYSAFPGIVIICPLLAKTLLNRKFLDFIIKMWSNIGGE